MGISIGDVEAQLVAIRSIHGDVRDLEHLLVQVEKIIKDEPPIWDQIDVTAGQRDVLLARYDSLKTSLKDKVEAF